MEHYDEAAGSPTGRRHGLPSEVTIDRQERLGPRAEAPELLRFWVAANDGRHRAPRYAGSVEHLLGALAAVPIRQWQVDADPDGGAWGDA